MNMRKYMTVIRAILLVTLSFCTTHIALAQEEVKWYYKEKEAFEAAEKQNKSILFIWGTDKCSDCIRAKKALNNDPSLKKLINKNFILWYSDFSKYDDGEDYSFRYNFTAPPLICVIDPKNPTSTSDYLAGNTFVNEIRAFLKKFESDNITE